MRHFELGLGRIGIFVLVAGAGSVAQAERILQILPAHQTLEAGGSVSFSVRLTDGATGQDLPAPGALEWVFEGQDGRVYRTAKGTFPFVGGEAPPSPAWAPGEGIKVRATIPGSTLSAEAVLFIQAAGTEAKLPRAVPKRGHPAQAEGESGCAQAAPKRARPFPSSPEGLSMVLPDPSVFPEEDESPRRAAGAARYNVDEGPSSSASTSRVRRAIPAARGRAAKGAGSAMWTPPRKAVAPGEVGRYRTPPSGPSSALAADLQPVFPSILTPRRYPKRSGSDKPAREGRSPLFFNSEILWDQIPGHPPVNVFQQQALSSCGPTVLAMRLEDLGLSSRFELLKEISTSQLTKADDLVAMIESRGIKASARKVPLPPAPLGAPLALRKSEILEKLSELLRECGPVITSLTDPFIEGHWIILDSLELGPATDEKAPAKPHAWIRDPYHGWAIPVTLDALLDRMIHENDPQCLLAIVPADPQGQGPVDTFDQGGMGLGQ